MKGVSFTVPVLVCVLVAVVLTFPAQSEPWQGGSAGGASQSSQSEHPTVTADDGFILIRDGSFTMGSPENEPWRSIRRALT